MRSVTCRMPTGCPAKTWLRLTLRRSTQIQPQWVTMAVEAAPAFNTLTSAKRSGEEKRTHYWKGVGRSCQARFERYNDGMADRPSPLAEWSPEQLAQGRAWASTWKRAGRALEEVRRHELRNVDTYAAIALLCGPADYHVAPRAPKPTSGLIEQQRLFRRAQHR